MASSKNIVDSRSVIAESVRKTGYLKKLKTMKKKFFVIQAGGKVGQARLEYYDSEKKFRAGAFPKRSIILNSCFNINKRTDSKNKFAISLYTKDDCFSIIAENEREQNDWLNLMLALQSDSSGDKPKPHFEFVWQVTVKPRDLGSHKNLTGHYRLCLTAQEISLVKNNSEVPMVTFQLGFIRRCGHTEGLFFMELGRSAVTGPGEVWMQVEDSTTAQSLHDQILGAMKAAGNPEFRSRSSSSSKVSHYDSEHTVDANVIYYSCDTFPVNRSRTVSEGQQHSPRKSHPKSSMMEKTRPQSMYNRTSAVAAAGQTSLSTSPISQFDYYQYSGHRFRSDSAESQSSVFVESHDYSSADFPIGMFTGHRSPHPTETAHQEAEDDSDYVRMTPGDTSSSLSTPERQGSAGSNWDDGANSEGYMEMRPGTPGTSDTNDSHEEGYMDMSPCSQISERDSSDGNSYIMMGTTKGLPSSSVGVHSPEAGYIEMAPGSLPTVKESGSPEEHYLSMTPPGQSPKGSCTLRPVRGISYLSDDSVSDEKEIPIRAYSLGSKPSSKTVVKPQSCQEKTITQGVLDSNRSSSAPHLISQKHKSYHTDYSLPSASPLSGSYKSEDSESFMEMEFCRPRTASDSYSSRPSASSFGKVIIQGHRPRSSSHSSRVGRLGSFESVRTTSEELLKKMSHESLHKDAHSAMQKKSSDYIDMTVSKGCLSKSQHSHTTLGDGGSSLPRGNSYDELPTYIDMSFTGSLKQHSSPTCDKSVKSTSQALSGMTDAVRHGDKFRSHLRESNDSLKYLGKLDKIQSYTRESSDVPRHANKPEQLHGHSKGHVSHKSTTESAVRRTQSVSHENRYHTSGKLSKGYITMDFPHSNKVVASEDSSPCTSVASATLSQGCKTKQSNDDSYIELSFKDSGSLKLTPEKHLKYEKSLSKHKPMDAAVGHKAFKTDSPYCELKSKDEYPVKSAYDLNCDPFFSTFPFKNQNEKMPDSFKASTKIEPYMVFSPGHQYIAEGTNMKTSKSADRLVEPPLELSDSKKRDGSMRKGTQSHGGRATHGPPPKQKSLPTDSSISYDLSLPLEPASSVSASSSDTNYINLDFSNRTKCAKASDLETRKTYSKAVEGETRVDSMDSSPENFDPVFVEESTGSQTPKRPDSSSPPTVLKDKPKDELVVEYPQAENQCENLQKSNSSSCMSTMSEVSSTADGIYSSQSSHSEISSLEEPESPGLSVCSGEKEDRELNYASLDLGSTETLTDSDSYPRSPKPVKSRHCSGTEECAVDPLTYVQIDFQKSESLRQNSTNQEVKFTL